MTLITKALLAVTIPAVMFSGCSSHKPPQTRTRAFINRSYIDLESGWRVRVVTPILKTGGFIVKTEQVQVKDGTVESRVSEDFVGYQTDYYSVQLPEGSGRLLKFDKAELTTGDVKRAKKTQPIFSLFDFSENIRYVRLLFLMRESQTDHDAAILGASSLADLDALTRVVELNPMEGCRSQARVACA